MVLILDQRVYLYPLTLGFRKPGILQAPSVAILRPHSAETISMLYLGETPGIMPWLVGVVVKRMREYSVQCCCPIPPNLTGITVIRPNRHTHTHPDSGDHLMPFVDQTYITHHMEYRGPSCILHPMILGDQATFLPPDYPMLTPG